VTSIVYLKQSPFRPYETERFGLDFFGGRGFEITALDVADICFPQLGHDDERRHYSSFDRFQIRTVRDPKSLQAEHSTLSRAAAIVVLAGSGGIDRHNLPVFRAVAAAKRPWIVLYTNAFPAINRLRDRPAWSGQRLVDAMFRYRSRRLVPINSLLARLPRGFLGANEASFAVYGGRRSLSQRRHVGRATRTILAHSMDYESVRSRGITASTTNIAVFVDQNLPFFRDGRAFGDEPAHIADRYFAVLDRFFSAVERRLGIEVVVAAAPSADYRPHANAFGGRKIFYQQTAELVARSRLVLGHRSTAMSYAVMFDKPVQIITSELIYRHYSQYVTIDLFAHEFGREVLFIDQPETIDYSRFLDIDQTVYATYFDSYIKMRESRQAPLWQIVHDDLQRAAVLP
jgi:hypothetical protein